MTLKEVLSKISEIKPHAYTDERLSETIIKLETRIHRDIIKDVYTPITLADNGNDQLTIGDGFGDAYIYRLAADIDLWDRNINEYNNNILIFDDIFKDWKAMRRRTTRSTSTAKITGMYPWLDNGITESEVF